MEAILAIGLSWLCTTWGTRLTFRTMLFLTSVLSSFYSFVALPFYVVQPVLDFHWGPLGNIPACAMPKCPLYRNEHI